MEQNAKRHADCRNFAPVDVTKGVCHLSSDVVAFDDASCAQCDPRPRCALCTHFAVGERAHLGTCHAGQREATAYPELSAMNCATFLWKKS